MLLEEAVVLLTGVSAICVMTESIESLLAEDVVITALLMLLDDGVFIVILVAIELVVVVTVLVEAAAVLVIAVYVRKSRN